MDQPLAQFPVWLKIANTFQAQGLHRQALQTLQQAYEATVADDPATIRIALLNKIADIHMVLGRWEIAGELIVETVLLARTENNPQILASTLNNFGNALAEAGDEKAARSAYNECIEISTTQQLNLLKNTALLNILKLEIRSQKIAQAQQRIHQIYQSSPYQKAIIKTNNC